MKQLPKTFCASLVLAGFVATAAHAAVDASTITTATATLVFATPSVLTHTLEAQPALPTSLPNSEVVAKGNVHTVSGSLIHLAYRFTPGLSDVDSADLGKAVVHGINDENNGVQLRLVSNPDGGTREDDGWIALNNNHSVFSYDVEADGAQTVAPDSYLLSIDAAVWNA